MPGTMTYKDWMDRTRLGMTSIRPPKLRAVDTALKEYNQVPSEQNLSRLWNALLTFVSGIGTSELAKDPRNHTGAYGQLLGEVQRLLGRRMLPFALRTELVKVAQERIKAQIYGGYAQKTVVDEFGGLTRLKIKKVGHVQDSDIMLKIVADKIQQDLDCKISYGPIKTLKSASRKVKDEYGGDWYQVKDAVRLTIIATNGGQLTGVTPDKLAVIGRKVRAVCLHSRGLSLLKDEEAKPGTPGHRPPGNACGYSGLNFVVRLSTGGESNLTGWNFAAAPLGWPGEIQANIPSMMYGKMSEQDLCHIFDRHEYQMLKAELDIEGGIAHDFYEIWRVDKDGANGKAAAELGGRYNDYLRTPHALRSLKAELVADIKKFKTANKAQFDKKH